VFHGDPLLLRSGYLPCGDCCILPSFVSHTVSADGRDGLHDPGMGRHATRQQGTLITTGRLDAMLHASPPERTRHTMGRPRVGGTRLPAPETARQKRTLDWDGEGKRTLESCTGTALWDRSGANPFPIRWVLTRDPTQTAEPIIHDGLTCWSLDEGVAASPGWATVFCSCHQPLHSLFSDTGVSLRRTFLSLFLAFSSILPPLLLVLPSVLLVLSSLPCRNTHAVYLVSGTLETLFHDLSAQFVGRGTLTGDTGEKCREGEFSYQVAFFCTGDKARKDAAGDGNFVSKDAGDDAPDQQSHLLRRMSIVVRWFFLATKPGARISACQIVKADAGVRRGPVPS